MFPFSVESEVTVGSAHSVEEHLHSLRARIEQEGVRTEMIDENCLQFRTPSSPFGTLLLFMRSLDGGRVCVDRTSAGLKVRYRLSMRRFWLMSLPGLAFIIGIMSLFPPPALLPVLIGILLCFMMGVCAYSYWGFRKFLTDGATGE